jgi:hypothetical protein
MIRGWRDWSLLVGLAVAPLTWGCLIPVSQLPADAAASEDSAGGTQVTNTPPVADAGEDQTVAAGVTVVLDGTNSADADNDQLLYFWRQTGGRPLVRLEGGSASRQQFEAPEVTAETVLTFQLTVVDGTWAAADEVRITVRPAS